MTTPTTLATVFPTRRPRHLTTPLRDTWTTGGDSTFLPTSTLPSDTAPSTTYPLAVTFNYSSSVTSGDQTFTTYSSVAVSTTFIVTTPVSASQTSSTVFSSTTPVGQVNSRLHPVCIGNGLDAAADGLIAAVVLPSAIGLLLWVCHLRPNRRLELTGFHW
jgi:hypothetical protein